MHIRLLTPSGFVNHIMRFFMLHRHIKTGIETFKGLMKAKGELSGKKDSQVET